VQAVALAAKKKREKKGKVEGAQEVNAALGWDEKCGGRREQQGRNKQPGVEP
jgi:hypothetical protein